ncbi:MAG: hypothetical protein BWY83_01454 [bacterium ADurb.Bin478]|nr:MAG: hypothetical protein BWY83_01454 [bacterium ADurb.Bin478]
MHGLRRVFDDQRRFRADLAGRVPHRIGEPGGQRAIDDLKLLRDGPIQRVEPIACRYIAVGAVIVQGERGKTIPEVDGHRSDGFCGAYPDPQGVAGLQRLIKMVKENLLYLRLGVENDLIG